MKKVVSKCGFYTLLFAHLFFSCDDSSDPSPASGELVVTAEDFAATVAQRLSQDTVLGMVRVLTSDSSTLRYDLVEQSVAGALSINQEDGTVSVADASALNLEVGDSLTATYTVTNGSASDQGRITVIVTGEGFITTWQIPTDNDNITIPAHPEQLGYDYLVDWGDGTISRNQTGDAGHTYSQAGTYKVTITGGFPAIYFSNSRDSIKDKLQTIEQWGDIAWQTMERAFIYCRNLTYNATDAPDLSGVTSLDGMFWGASRFDGDIGNWNVSRVTDMSAMFQDARVFNQDIGDWDVSQVTDMRGMFTMAQTFSQDISDWNVSRVTDMGSMFAGAEVFDQNLSNWKVDAVTFCQSFANNSNLPASHQPNFTNCIP